MDSSSAYVCKAFLEQCEPAEKLSLFRYLPETGAQLLEQLPVPSLNRKKGFVSSKNVLDQIHFSWFAPHLRTLSENDIRLFLSALTPQQAEGLKAVLLFSDHFPELTDSSSVFVQDILMKKLIGKEQVLPLNLLPESPLNPLLDLTLEELEVLIRHLGLHDLAFEMRQIIETAKLKRIFAALAKTEKDYIQSLLPQKEAIILKRIHLQNWDGRRESLKLLIQQKGLQRLGKALYGEHPTLIWFVARKLDIAMGQELIKACTKLEIAKAKQHLVNQILKILSFVKKGNS